MVPVYQVLNVDRILLVKQNYFEFDALGNERQYSSNGIRVRWSYSQESVITPDLSSHGMYGGHVAHFHRIVWTIHDNYHTIQK